jgi:hypothetical protein
LKSETLRLTKPFGKTIWLMLIWLIIFLSAAELLARWEVFQTTLTPPNMGSRHYQLGHKLTLLEAAAQQGPIDCLMVGSSVTDLGFDPAAFEKGFQSVTGQRIRCFNFGIDAGSTASTAALVQILIEGYRPRLLIFGTDARDYAVSPSDPDAAVVLDSPWVKYHRGDFSLEGWLLDHAYLYRYRQHLSRLARFHFEDTLWSQTKLNFEIRPNGFTPINKVSTYINDPPDPQDDSYEVTYYKRIYTDYQILDDNLTAFEEILSYNNAATQVFVIEMPISDGLYYFFGNGTTDYDRFITQVSELSLRYQVPFWRTEPLDAIPDDGWYDYSHMNIIGAAIFSTWLGQQVGEFEALENK